MPCLQRPVVPAVDADYPAGHSMDSTWFAVDTHGEVAFFDTGEGGALPVDGFALGGEAGGETAVEGSELALALLRLRAQDDPELASLLPETLEAWDELLDYEDIYQLLVSLGVWVYACGEADAYPYLRIGSPLTPAHVSQLPQRVQQQLQSGRLGLAFRETEQLSPGEHCAVETWSGVWFDTESRPHLAHSGTAKQLRDALEEAKQFPAPARDMAQVAAEFWAKPPLDRVGLLQFLRQRLDERQAHRAKHAAAQATAPPARHWFSRWFGKR